MTKSFRLKTRSIFASVRPGAYGLPSPATVFEPHLLCSLADRGLVGVLSVRSPRYVFVAAAAEVLNVFRSFVGDIVPLPTIAQVVRFGTR